MIISVYGIARPEEQASLVAGGGSGKCRDPLWRIGHYFSRVKAHAITTPIRVAHRLPTSNEHRILPNPLQELSQDLHATHFKEGTRNQHIRHICVGLCGVRNFTTTPVPAVAYPNQGEIRISFQSQLRTHGS